MATGKPNKRIPSNGRKRFVIKLRAASVKSKTDLSTIRKATLKTKNTDGKKLINLPISSKALRKSVEAYKKLEAQYLMEEEEEEIFKGVSFATNTDRLFDIVPDSDYFTGFVDQLSGNINNTYGYPLDSTGGLYTLDGVVDNVIREFYDYSKFNLDMLDPNVEKEDLKVYGQVLDSMYPEVEENIFKGFTEDGSASGAYQYPAYTQGPMSVMAAPSLTPENELEDFKQVLAFYSDPLHDFKASRMESLPKDQARFAELYIEHLVEETKKTLKTSRPEAYNKISLINNAENVTFNNIFNNTASYSCW